MSRVIRLLHVEDDEIQRRLLRAILDKLPQYRFQTTYAASEDSAVDAFGAGFDLVLLDYTLTSGDGLSCLRRLRQLDNSVPIIAVSGAADAETAADLVGAGADDFFSKNALDPTALGVSLEAALARADAWRNRAPDIEPELHARLTGLVEDICDQLRDSLGAEFLAKLDDLEEAAREARLTSSQTLRLFEAAAARDDDGEEEIVRGLLRPVMFDLVFRVFEEAPANVYR